MSHRTGEYICMGVADFMTVFEEGEVSVGQATWELKDCTVIFLEQSETPVHIQMALWVEAQLSWCVEYEDDYSLATSGGLHQSHFTIVLCQKQFARFRGSDHTCCH